MRCGAVTINCGDIKQVEAPQSIRASTGSGEIASSVTESKNEKGDVDERRGLRESLETHSLVSSLYSRFKNSLLLPESATIFPDRVR